jgi:hypothetical protein
MKTSFVAAATVVLMASAAVSHADNNICAGATFIVPDGSPQEGDLGKGSDRWYRFAAKGRRSYALMLENLAPGNEQGEIGVLGSWSGCGGSSVSSNDVLDPQEPASIDPTFSVGATRQAIKTTNDTEVFVQVGGLNASNPAHIRLRVVETTLFSPLWSTASGLTTNYRFLNTTNRGCSVTLSLRLGDNGVPAGAKNTVTFNLPANNSVTRSTGAGDMNLQAGHNGHATITHNCTPGAILVDAYLSNASGPVRPLMIAPRPQH